MPLCEIVHIPSRLHSLDKPDIPEFSINELIFRRCKEEDIENPFDSFQLYDISVNREGMPDNKLSEPEDVLWNFAPERNSFEKYSESIVYLTVKELNDSNAYEKKSDSHIDPKDNVVLKLTHKKIPCNYAHCTFEIHYNGIEVSKLNYKETIKRNSILKTWCKNELSKMQIKREVRINWK
jgi:hypothetical protein